MSQKNNKKKKNTNNTKGNKIVNLFSLLAIAGFVYGFFGQFNAYGFTQTGMLNFIMIVLSIYVIAANSISESKSLKAISLCSLVFVLGNEIINTVDTFNRAIMTTLIFEKTRFIVLFVAFVFLIISTVCYLNCELGESKKVLLSAKVFIVLAIITLLISNIMLWDVASKQYVVLSFTIINSIESLARILVLANVCIINSNR